MSSHIEPASEGLQIIGAGFGRTGTFSLKLALEALGFGPCYHMMEFFQRPQDAPLWEAAASGETVDWRSIFADYRATVDWPSCAFYEDLMRVYPEARVILTVRDPERWYESAINTIANRSRGANLDAPIESLSPQEQANRHMITAVIWQGTFDDRFEDKQHAIAIYEQHIAQVKQRVPAAKLLVYEVSEGWTPLCDFLGVAAPTDIPFPYRNTRDEFLNNMR